MPDPTTAPHADFAHLTEDELSTYVAESAQRPGEPTSDHAVRAAQLRAEYVARNNERAAAAQRVEQSPASEGGESQAQ